jgi:hypothetical protein
VAWVHAREQGTGERAVAMVAAAMEVAEGPVAAPDLVLAEG